jgi:hypothetical protein
MVQNSEEEIVYGKYRNIKRSLKQPVKERAGDTRR